MFRTAQSKQAVFQVGEDFHMREIEGELDDRTTRCRSNGRSGFDHRAGIVEAIDGIRACGHLIGIAETVAVGVFRHRIGSDTHFFAISQSITVGVFVAVVHAVSIAVNQIGIGERRVDLIRVGYTIVIVVGIADVGNPIAVVITIGIVDDGFFEITRDVVGRIFQFNVNDSGSVPRDGFDRMTRNQWAERRPGDSGKIGSVGHAHFGRIRRGVDSDVDTIVIDVSSAVV